MRPPHPLTRLLALGAVVQMALLVEHPLAAAPLAVAVAAAALLCGAGRALARLWSLLVLLPVLSVLLWTFAFPPAGRGSDASALFGLGMGVRLETMLLAGILFVVATRPEEIQHALQTLRMPYRIAFAFTLAVRLFPLFATTARGIVAAQRARGIDLGSGGPWGRLRRTAPLLVPVLACGLRQADRLSVALESRGFGRRSGRSAWLAPRAGLGDALLLAALAGLEAFVLWLRWRI